MIVGASTSRRPTSNSMSARQARFTNIARLALEVLGHAAILQSDDPGAAWSTSPRRARASPRVDPLRKLAMRKPAKAMSQELGADPRFLAAVALFNSGDWFPCHDGF